MTHRFSTVPTAEIQRSSFDRTHGYKTTFDAGYLIPFYADEVVPGDTFAVNATFLVRLNTPIFPIMDNLHFDVFWFACPLRLIQTNWVKLLGEQDDPGDSIDFTAPTITTAAGVTEESLSDYLGIPPGIAGLEFDSYWHRMYNLTWNQWFRDENLQDSVVVDKDDGPDDEADYVLLRRGKRHDYFTSGLPWPQKGDSVSIPLGTTAPVNVDVTAGSDVGVYSTDAAGYRFLYTPGTPPDNVALRSSAATAGDSLYADLSTATAATINQLRQSFQIQRMLERDARGGTRHQEIILSHFGVRSPDSRVQRVEYLGSSSQLINVTPVAQQSATDAAVTPQGNLAAFGSTVARSGFTKSFTEHCVLLGLCNVRADLTYQQGLNRMFSRQTRYDWYWPALAHIGEQTILNKEIYAQGTAGGTDDDSVFAYQERWAEMRYKPSLITGAFRSSAAAPLDAWHLSQEFGSLPVLDSTFIQDDPPMDRVVAVTDEPDFLMDCHIQMRCVRPMPVYGVPGLIDHF